MKAFTVSLIMTFTVVACGNNDGDLDGDYQIAEAYYPGEDIELDESQSDKLGELLEEHPGREEHMLRLAARLELSDEQIAELQPIFDTLHTNLKGIHDQIRALIDVGTRPDRETVQPLHEQMRTLKETAREEIRPILTDEQNTAFDKLVQECRKRHHGPPRGSEGGERGEK